MIECRANRSRQELYTDKDSGTVYMHTAQGVINGSLRVVDLTSGRVLAAQRFEGDGNLESSQAPPDPAAALGEARAR